MNDVLLNNTTQKVKSQVNLTLRTIFKLLEKAGIPKRNGKYYVIPLNGKIPIKGLPLEKIYDGEEVEIEIPENVSSFGLWTGGHWLVVLDFDDEESFEKFKQVCPPELLNTLIVKTRRGYHVYFIVKDKDVKDEQMRRFHKVDIKTGRSYVVLPFSRVDDFTYKVELFVQVKKIKYEEYQNILNLLSSLFSQEEGTEKDLKHQKDDLSISQKENEALSLEILALLESYYIKGQRQNFVLYVSGVFRKAGVPKEVAIKVIEDFCKKKGDEELKMRLEAVKYTYEETKPEESIAGISGLEEVLQVKEGDLLKLKALLSQRKGLDEYFEIFTATELSQKEFSPPQWLIPSLLPEGLSILTGKPKVGKSFLALLFAAEIARTGKTVVYLALEDKPQRLKQRLKIIKAEEVPTLFLACPTKPIRIGQGGWKYLQELVKRYSPSLLVIDPWIKIKPILPKKFDPYAMDYEALEMIKKLNHNVLIVHHKRKAESEDPLDEVLGTTGITGAVDTILSLKRTRGGDVGTLEIIPKDFKEQSLALSFNGGLWQILGETKEVIIAEEQRKILDAIKELGGKATIKQIAEWLGKNYRTVQTHVNVLRQKNLLSAKDGYYTLTKEEGPFVNPINPINHINPINPLILPSPLGGQND
jgi:hypothetical protein